MAFNYRDQSIHSRGVGSEGHIEATTDFDYSAVDSALGFESEAENVNWQDMVGALSLILGFICGNVNRRDPTKAIVTAGAKACVIYYWLDPVNSRFKSLEEIAKSSGMTKAAASGWLCDLRSQLGGILPLKLSGANETYRQAQLAAKARGLHASDIVRRRKEQEQEDMNGVEG